MSQSKRLGLADIHARRLLRQNVAHAQDTAVTAQGDNVRIHITGRYDHFTGTYDLVVTPVGEITVTSSFVYSGPDIFAREVGMRIGVPRTCDQLQWSRRAEWNVYPDDHIGRPKGSAKAIEDHSPQVPPRWPWALDNSSLGTCDFRSTKRNINWAALKALRGSAIQIVSDGTQSVRATLEGDRISLCVNDWYGGTGSGLGEWETNYGKGRLIKSGEKLESTVHLRLVRIPRF